MNTKEVARKITKRTRAILAVHIYGHPVDMDPLSALAKQHNIALIEDAAEGLGSLYVPTRPGKAKKVGSIGDISCFSFYANKVVTTGEGGMVVTNNTRLARRIRALHDMAHHPAKRFQHTELGFTYRMSNMQAAVGLASLEQIEKTIQKKRWVAHTYNTQLTNIPFLTLHTEQSWATSVYWVYGVLLNTKAISRDTFRKKLLQQGIDTREFFMPAHSQPALKKLSIPTSGSYPVAQYLSKQGLYLPSGPDITKKDILFVCHTIQSIYEHL